MHAPVDSLTTLALQVEIDTEVPAAEFEGIAEQMQRLDDLESLQDDWKAQAESRDEVCARVHAYVCKMTAAARTCRDSPWIRYEHLYICVRACVCGCVHVRMLCVNACVCVCVCTRASLART